MPCHGLYEEASVEKQVPHLATRFCNEQAAVAGGAVGRPVPASTIGIMVCTNWVVRADQQPIESASQNSGESRSSSNKPTQGALGSGRRCVDKDSASGGRTIVASIAERVDAFL